MNAFKRGHVEKNYLALVYGKVELNKIQCYGVNSNNGIIEVRIAIGDDAVDYAHRCSPLFGQDGKKLGNCLNPKLTHTKIKILEYGNYKGRSCTKILLQPVTGKRHQLRVVMNYLNHPVVGDRTYGVEDFDSYRTMLHAYKIEINIHKAQLLTGKAPDPFLNSIDSDWIPHTVVNELNI